MAPGIETVILIALFVLPKYLVLLTTIAGIIILADVTALRVQGVFPLTLALSPEYRGEGTMNATALRFIFHFSFLIFSDEYLRLLCL